MTMATILFYFFFFFFFFFLAFARADNCLLRTDLPHSTFPMMSVNSLCYPFRANTQPLWNKTVLQTQFNDRARLSYLSNLAVVRGSRSSVPIAYGKLLTLNPTYVVQTLIGEHAQKMLLAIDTTQDVTLVPCTGCKGCSDDKPVYNTSNSKSFKTVKCSNQQCKIPGKTETCHSGNDPCVLRSTYRLSDFSANLVQDNIILGSNLSIPGYTFGCIKTVISTSIPAQGMLGLGQQSLSLLSQTYKLYKSTFSYCLPSPSVRTPKFSGSLTLGTGNLPKNMQTTRLLGLTPYYYANLTGIMVGKKLLNIKTSRDKSFGGSGIGIGNGTIIDSGTVYSVLVVPAYTAMRDEIIRKMGNKAPISFVGFDTCYKKPAKKWIGSITLMFPRMNFTLRRENFLTRSSGTGLVCLAMLTQPQARYNVIGSFQQQNHRMFFDIPNSKLGVAPERCS